MSDERYVSDRSWPAERSERRDDGARSGLGTMARPGGRPRPERTAEGDGPATQQQPRRGRQARPVPPQRPAAAQQAQRPAAAQQAQRPAAAQQAQRPAAAQQAQRPAAAQQAQRPAAAQQGLPVREQDAGRRAAGPRNQRVAPPRPRPAMPRVPQEDPAQPGQQQGAPGQAAEPQQPGAQPAAAGPHRMPFVLLLCGLLGGALISALVISTTLAEGSFKISKLQDSTSALARQGQALEDQVAQSQSAQVIEERAAKLGMRRANELLFVNLKTGKVTDDGPTWAGAVKAPGYAP